MTLLVGGLGVEVRCDLAGGTTVMDRPSFLEIRLELEV